MRPENSEYSYLDEMVRDFDVMVMLMTWKGYVDDLEKGPNPVPESVPR